MEPTPKPNTGRKASKVRVTKADGTAEVQNAYNAFELAKVRSGIPEQRRKRKTGMANPKIRKQVIAKRKAKKAIQRQAQWEQTMKEREAMFVDNRVHRFEPEREKN